MEVLDIVLICIVAALLLILMWKWRNGLDNEMNLPQDEEIAKKIGEFRGAILNDIAAYIASRYADLIAAEEIDIASYQTSYDNSILKMHLPNDCVHTIEINWQTNKYIMTSQYLPADGSPIQSYSSTDVLRQGYLVDFTPFQEHLDEFLNMIDLPVRVSDLSVNDIIGGIKEAIADGDIKMDTDEEKNVLLFNAVDNLTDSLEDSAVKGNLQVIQGVTQLLTYVLVKFTPEEIRKYLEDDSDNNEKEDE